MTRASDPGAGGPEGAGGAEQGGAGGDIYTMIEAARLKGVSYHTVSRAVRRGKLPAQRLGRMALITADDLRAWRPMRERAPRKYRRREPNPEAAPALLDLASGQRVDLARQLSTFYELLHGAATELPLADFLALVCDRLASALDFRRVAIWGTYPGDPRAIRLATFGPRFRELPAEIVVAEAPAFTGLMEPEAAYVVPQVRGLHGGGRGPAITSLFVAPLRVGGDRVGVIVADRGGEPFTLSQDQLWLAQAMANQAALVMEQARLRAAESERADELAAILETLTEAVFACDASGRMTVCNAAGRELLGIGASTLSESGDARDILGRQERQTLDGRPLPVNETPLIRALSGKAVHAARYRLIDANTGATRIVSESAVPILRDGRVAGAVAVARIVPEDVSGGESSGSGPPAKTSGLGRGGASFDAPQVALERAEDEFLSVLAHEIRNPLTSLRGNLQLLERQVRKDPSRTTELERLESVLRQTDRMTLLVNRLFDVSRADLDRFDLSLGLTDAATLAHRAVETAGGVLARENVVVDVPDALPVVWDEERIEQVLANLLSNAAKYAPIGGIEVSIRPVEPDGIEIAVRDHGPGVPEARKAQIFERYYRMRDSDARAAEGGEPEGLGLGLYISRQLTLAHGGELRVENAVGGGARFVVMLPRDATPFVAGSD